MLQAAIVGDRGSGKTTFLGLLYAALVKSGSDKEDDLRFHATFESLEEITALFQQLMSGGFPDAAIKEGLHELSFTLGLRKPRHGRFPHLGSRKWNADAATSVHFTLPGSLGEERSGFLQGSTIGTGPWRDVLDADALILLADSTKLAPKGDSSERGPMATYDGQVDALFSAIQRWRSRSGHPVLHPVFLLSKFDSVDPEVLKAADLEADPPEVARSDARAAYADALLEPNLPRTLKTVRGTSRGRLRFGEPSYFFSWVRPDVQGAGPQEKIKLRRTDGGGWEPDYSRGEYLALLERLAEIAAKTKD
jgi:hypothetical protein